MSKFLGFTALSLILTGCSVGTLASFTKVTPTSTPESPSVTNIYNRASVSNGQQISPNTYTKEKKTIIINSPAPVAPSIVTYTPEPVPTVFKTPEPLPIFTPTPIPTVTPELPKESPTPVYNNEDIKSNNVLKNGNFEEGLKYWTKINEGKGQQEINIYAVTVREHQAHLAVRTGEGSVGLYQDITTGSFKTAIFRADLKPDGNEGLYWGMGMPGVGGINIDYRTKIGEYLGSTTIAAYQHNPFEGTFLGVPIPPSSNNANHFITIPNGTWRNRIVVDIVKEINDNLSGIAIEQVESLTITLFASNSNSFPQSFGELFADNISLEIEKMKTQTQPNITPVQPNYNTNTPQSPATEQNIPLPILPQNQLNQPVVQSNYTIFIKQDYIYLSRTAEELKCGTTVSENPTNYMILRPNIYCSNLNDINVKKDTTSDLTNYYRYKIPSSVNNKDYYFAFSSRPSSSSNDWYKGTWVANDAILESDIDPKLQKSPVCNGIWYKVHPGF